MASNLAPRTRLYPDSAGGLRRVQRLPQSAEAANVGFYPPGFAAHCY